jgi:hypothetical protein
MRALEIAVAFLSKLDFLFSSMLLIKIIVALNDTKYDFSWVDETSYFVYVYLGLSYNYFL